MTTKVGLGLSQLTLYHFLGDSTLGVPGLPLNMKGDSVRGRDMPPMLAVRVACNGKNDAP